MKKTLSFAILALISSQSFANYHPEEGRWISRDPIGERGGQNLYGFVKNDCITKTDKLGLAATVSGTTKIDMQDCGSFDWQFDWILRDLTADMPQDGSIIQEMQWRVKVRDCEDGHVIKKFDTHIYTEAFIISGGTLASDPDSWRFSAEDFLADEEVKCGTYGLLEENMWTGIANYYDYRPDPNHGWVQNPPVQGGGFEHPWGGLWGMQGVIDLGKPAAIGYERRLKISWNCCNNSHNKKTQYQYVGGSATREHF